MMSTLSDLGNAEQHRLLINTDSLVPADKQAALRDVLDILKNKASSQPDFDWSDLCEKLLTIDISQHPRRIQDSENQLEILIKKYHDKLPDDREALRTMSDNLFLLSSASIVKSNHKLVHDVSLLDKIITKRRILATPEFVAARQWLNNFKKKYKNKTRDQFFKYAIGFNAGLNTGSSFYSVMTALFLTVPVLIVSGALSLILCFAIAHYFYNSYKDEDHELQDVLKKHARKLTSLAYKESLLRLKCYKLISQKMALLQQCPPAKISMIRDTDKLQKLVENFNYDNPTGMLDNFINNKLATYPQVASLFAATPMTPTIVQNSIYTRVFHSKYWGPILNFFGAAGTSFGVVKTVLAIAGITALAGSPLGLLALITGVTVVVGAMFAIKHLRFTIKSEEKKSYLKQFQANQLHHLKIKTDQLRKFKNSLVTDLIYLNNIAPQIATRPNSPTQAPELISAPTVPASQMNTNLLTVNFGLFREESSYGNAIQPLPAQQQSSPPKPGQSLMFAN